MGHLIPWNTTVSASTCASPSPVNGLPSRNGERRLPTSFHTHRKNWGRTTSCSGWHERETLYAKNASGDAPTFLTPEATVRLCDTETVRLCL